MTMYVVRTEVLCAVFTLLWCRYGGLISVWRTSRDDTPPATGCGTVLGKLRGRPLVHSNSPPETVHGTFSVFEDSPEEETLQQTNRSVENHLWPTVDGVVSLPYLIAKKVGNKTNDICEAFKMISQKTCISFHERTTETDYLSFVDGHGCASFVGRRGGPQPVLIGPSCHPGNICHELLHALGFYHEHMRQDRDRYISVLYKNVKKGREREFLATNASMQDLPYDLKSIMHYGKYYFSANGQPTIVAKTKGVNIGQRRHLSELDVQRIRKLYSCEMYVGESQRSE